MCGRYTLRRTDLPTYHEFVAARLAAADEFSESKVELFPYRPDPFKALRPRYNIAPSQDVPVIRLDKDGRPVTGDVRWGLIPSWTKGKPKVQPINARGETVASSGMFRQALERRRCLVPADGFYEWKRLDAKTKQPMFIRRPDDGVFAFAGLWERWRPEPEAEPVDTFTIITTTPNAVMREIHDRMPVIVKPADYERWLDRDVPAADVAGLLVPYPDGELEAQRVSTLVNSPKNDEPACVEPVE